MSQSPDLAPSVGITPDPGAKALSDLWDRAIAQHREDHKNESLDLELVIRRISPTRDMSEVVMKCAGDFKTFRDEGSRIRSILTPIAKVISSFVDAGSDAASVSSESLEVRRIPF